MMYSNYRKAVAIHSAKSFVSMATNFIHLCKDTIFTKTFLEGILKQREAITVDEWCTTCNARLAHHQMCHARDCSLKALHEDVGLPTKMIEE